MPTMGAAHRNERDHEISSALKGRNILAMGAAHRNETDQKRQP